MNKLQAIKEYLEELRDDLEIDDLGSDTTTIRFYLNDRIEDLEDELEA